MSQIETNEFIGLQNYVFSACHPDFLRQIAFYLQRTTYYRGNNICKQGDVNNKMYFIQSGKISVIDESKSVGAERYVKEVLHTKDCFGLVSTRRQRSLSPNSWIVLESFSGIRF